MPFTWLALQLFITFTVSFLVKPSPAARSTAEVGPIFSSFRCCFAWGKKLA